mgnify:CR=1 FL=1
MSTITLTKCDPSFLKNPSFATGTGCVYIVLIIVVVLIIILFVAVDLRQLYLQQQQKQFIYPQILMYNIVFFLKKILINQWHWPPELTKKLIW